MPSLTDSIGRVLGDRYRLVTAVGTGASAHVYLADDVSLRRQVAIKVLHPALAGDQAFLKRFRAEARAVAALNHPNILRVYDWGEEGGEPYLVLEYLAGGSLRQIYDTGTLLTPEQAVRIGIEACAGLDYAHRRGLIHRDIKPANVLFDGDGRLRIADFGLARALAEAAWTEPDGAILGTARYAAPEQVEGWVLDGKADVYGLALVLYEGVTGEAAFVGDTTVATLMARIGALLPEHEALGSLAGVLSWAAAPDPAERYDAARFGAELATLATTLPEPAPLPLVTPEREEEDPFLLAAAVGLTPASERPVVVARPRADTPDDMTELGAPAGTPAAEAQADGPDPDLGGPRRRRRRWPYVVALCVLVAALAAAGVAWAVQAKVFTPSVPVPVLVGRTLPAAESAARAVHLEVRVTGRTTSITVPAGSVVGQQPSATTGGARTTLKQGSAVGVLLSTGPPQVAIPNLASFTDCHDAVQALAGVHLVGVCPDSAAQYDSTVPAGAIVGTSPTGQAPYGSTVTIVTSKGHAPVAVPSVAGSGTTYTSAASALTAAGFAPQESKVYSSTVPADQVIGTVPAAGGSQPFGSAVTVQVSLGPQPVTVPSLTEQSPAAATAALTALGLVPGGPYGPPGGKTVVSTSPSAGTSVPVGSTVDVYTR